MNEDRAAIVRQVGQRAHEYHRLQQQLRQVRLELYDLLRAGIAAGCTHTEMGDAAGISRTRVKQVVNGSQ